jgi:hypothetical protein
MNQEQSQHWASDQEKVEAFIFHRIDQAEQMQMAAHIDLCDECRHIVQEERELIAGIRYAGRGEMKLRLKQWIRRDHEKRFDWTQAASLAAAIVLMLGAVFAIRWFTDLNESTGRQHEIVLNHDDSSQRSLWIMGTVLVKQRVFRGTLSVRNPSFIIRQGTITQTVSIRRTPMADLPLNMKNVDNAAIRTFLERTPRGLQLTLYMDTITDSLATGIEALTSDSLIVYVQGQQIAYRIPGGWAGKM